MAKQAGAVLLACGIAAASGFGALVGTTFGLGLTCDDSCSSAPPWREDPHAWQWQAFGWVAIAGFACALVFLAAIALRRRSASLATLAAWVLLAAAFMTLFRESGLTSNAGRGWAAIVVLFGAGVIAIALTRSPARA